MNNKHESIKKVLKVIGPIILVVGIVLFIATIITMSSDSFGMTVFTGFGGVACIGIGSICTSIGYGREITKG